MKEYINDSWEPEHYIQLGMIVVGIIWLLFNSIAGSVWIVGGIMYGAIHSISR